MSIEIYGRYQLLRRLATGGMAQIYLARQQGPEGFEKVMVVKRILPHLAENDEFVRMFLDEARIAARLNHPNIVQIYDLGAQDDTYFIAMEYIRGEDVRRVWKRSEAMGKPLPLPLACRIIMDACAGLDYAHKKTDPSGKPLGIVHRDVSPQNILVSLEGAVKVVDFGIAKAADQATVTRSGVLKGKYSYMSPEQASGRPVDCRSDIFALGVVLYELLTGTRLFKRANDILTLNAVMDCEVQPPSQVNPQVPPDLDPVLMKALAKDPDARYLEAVQLQVALEEWLLSRKLPSSSVHLAAFMGELYADWAAREAEEGRATGPEPTRPRRTPTGNVRRATPRPPERTPSRRSVRSPAPRPSLPSVSVDLESAAARPGRPEAPGIDVTLSASRLRPPKRRLPAIAGAVAALVLLAGVGAFWAMQESGAVVRISSDPPGAKVVFDGKLLAEPTPCDLPRVPGGSYTLSLSKPGYREHQMTIRVPESGQLTYPTIALEPEQEVEPAPDAGSIAAPPVLLTIRSDPPGATLFVAGEEHGRTPQELEVLGNRSLSLRLALEGYQEVERTVELGADATQELTVPLERTRNAVKIAMARVEPKTAERREPRQTGTVRFVIDPWADVVCNGRKLGQTPFPDQHLPAGRYECKFTNAELGVVKTEQVEVRPNDIVKVTIDLMPGAVGN